MLNKLADIRLLAFDLDGVMTDGKLMILPDGNWVRQMDIKDGFAIQLAIKSGIEIAVISGSNSLPIKQRLEKLGVRFFFENVSRKDEVLKELTFSLGLERFQVMFMGDDIPDLAAFEVAGFRSCPADACWEVRQQSDYISNHEGGKGCVRDVIEKTLKLQGKWNFMNHISSI